MENTNSEKKSRGRPRIYNYPNELVCTITGKKVKTNPIQFKKQLEKSGLSQEEYIKNFVSREGKKIIHPKPVKKARVAKINESIQDLKEGLQKEVDAAKQLAKELGPQLQKISPERLALLKKYFPNNTEK